MEYLTLKKHGTNGTLCHIMAQKIMLQFTRTEEKKRGDDKQMRANKSISLERLVANGRLQSRLEHYLESCRPPPNADPKHPGGRFPNIAGFCRWLGCGVSEFDALKLSHPQEADWLTAVMEDEALNSQLISATLLGTYLKRRLGYSDKTEAVSGTDCGEMRLIFEHDIAEDGL